MTRDPFIMLPRDSVNRIAATEDSGGRLVLTHLPSEELYVVTRLELRSGAGIPVDIPTSYQALRWSGTSHTAQWFKRPHEHVNLAHLDMVRRPGSAIPLETFKSWVPGVHDPGNTHGFVITIDTHLSEEHRLARAREYAGWIVAREGVRAIDIAVEPERIGLKQLADQWPLDRLAQDTVMVVGLGSIGGAAAEQLAAMGIGRTILVDPDRFLWHNEIRHVLGKRYIGRFKVDAMKDHLNERWPDHQAVPFPVDVVEAADDVRALAHRVDLVLCAADGIAPRRVVSHLAKRAGRASVHACVLNDGGVGEVLRLRPGPRFGCLLCHRAAHAAADGIDPEADQELAYGEGLVHKPMTAIPTDLHLVGSMAAKVAAATLLEGKHGQLFSLPGEHAVIGLRANQMLTAPFDVTAVGEVKWHPISLPRPYCATCTPMAPGSTAGG